MKLTLWLPKVPSAGPNAGASPFLVPDPWFKDLILLSGVILRVLEHP
jgi:hypothetical protein